VDRQIAVTLLSDLDATGNAAEVTAAFKEAVSDYALPDGVTLLDAGENAANEELFMALGFGFVIAVLLIFSILVIQFNSFAQPAIILFTIVMSLVGVNFGLFFTDTPRSLAFIIGVISLAGIVVNDAIILVDRINKLRRGYESETKLEQIIAHAGGSRIIPIMLTTLTTAAGIGPLIWVDQFWAGLSITVICGLMVASTLTLFVTPAMYTQISCEGKVTFAPLGILAGLGLLLPGIFSFNLVLIVIGGIFTSLFAWVFWCGYQIVRMQGDNVIARA
jgi:HAE1 family hydrophobic/amphiphilic exporter-1